MTIHCISTNHIVINDLNGPSKANIPRSSNGHIDWVHETGYAITAHPINTPFC